MSVTTDTTSQAAVDFEALYSERPLGRVSLPTGAEIAYVDQGDPADPPVVLLHVLSDSSWPFAAGVMDHLGIDRATVVGHSLGTMVARAFALRYGSRVDRLVLVSTLAAPANEAAAELGATVAEFTDRVPEDFVREFQESTIADAVPAGYFERVISEGLRLPAHVWRQAVARLGPARRDQRPDTVDVGGPGPWFPREEQDRVTSAIPGARLAVLEGAGHAPHWERPDEAASVLTEFLQETGGTDR